MTFKKRSPFPFMEEGITPNDASHLMRFPSSYGYIHGHPHGHVHELHMDMSMDIHMEVPIKSKVSKLTRFMYMNQATTSPRPTALEQQQPVPR